MITFKEFMRKSERPVIVLHIFDEGDADALAFVSRYLIEGGRTYSIGKGYSAVFHRAHTPGTQNHLHFYLKQNHLYSINQDGTAHDASHGLKMHRQATKWISKEFPNFTVPPKGIIESMFDPIQPRMAGVRGILAEAFRQEPLVPASVVTAALNLASLDGNI